jgi:cytochrome c oxidase subunit 2
MSHASRLLRFASIAALAAGAAGCDAQSMFKPAGPAARTLSHVGWFVLLTFAAATLVTWALLAWVAMRRRGTLAEHEPIDADSGMNWILIGGFGIPVLVLAVVFILALRTMSAFPMEHAHGDPEIRVTGHQWWFEVEYRMGGTDHWVSTATEIHIPVGRPIDIALATADVIHSFWVPPLHGKVDLVPGMVNHIRIQADREGRYPGECAEYCGMQHANMKLYVVAEPAEQFSRWLDAERQPAITPATDQARAGQQIVIQGACALCHTVRGTPALGTVGPDLTHLANRETLAGGMLPNNIANLHAWVTHAQSLKPGAEMPDLNQFTGDQLHDVVAYLRTLR